MGIERRITEGDMIKGVRQIMPRIGGDTNRMSEVANHLRDTIINMTLLDTNGFAGGSLASQSLPPRIRPCTSGSDEAQIGKPLLNRLMIMLRVCRILIIF